MTRDPALEFPIYHITTHELWSAASANQTYAAPSLHTEGFIHCSRHDQVERSMNRFFNDHDSVILLRIDPTLLHSELKYEPADGDQFPHIYGDLNVDAVMEVDYISREEDGKFHLQLEQ